MKKKNKNYKISTEDFDKKFDSGEDIDEYLDLKSAEHINLDIQRINLDLPKWMLTALDIEAARLGIPRQAVIKIMLDSFLSKKSA